MKLLFKCYLTPSLLLASLLFISIDSMAKTGEQASKVKIKCHVELMGGTDIIHFGIIKTNSITKYTHWLVGKKVATGISKKKQQIHKVKECVKSQDDFTSAVSKQLDENTAR